uniref:Cation_ATPase_N domain-containing protein n=1 Tax=Globodera pallida TaxID=36090 RepID=A0A183CNE2_GLOPA
VRLEVMEQVLAEIDKRLDSLHPALIYNWIKRERRFYSTLFLTDYGKIIAKHRDSAGVSGAFDVTLGELRTLMEFRGEEALEKINTDFGDTVGLCQRLSTDPNSGVLNTQEELKRRRDAFGANEIPPIPPKSFFAFVWKALRFVGLSFFIAANCQI